MTKWRNRIVRSGIEAPDQLLANPFNARIHSTFQQQALEGVLDDIGWIQQVVVNEVTQHVIDGHLRVALALRFDEPEVPVLYVSLTEQEEKIALVTFDTITSLATYDAAQLDALLQSVNSDNAAITQMLAGLAESAGLYVDAKGADAPDAQIDRADELLKVWQCERGQLWIIRSKSGKGVHKLLCGDSTNADDVARVMAGERADMVFTDPPYNVTDNNWDKFKHSEFIEFLKATATSLKDIASKNCSLYICLNWRFIANLKLILDEYFIIKNWIIWFHSSRGADFKFYTPSHQDILFYVNSNEYYFNPDAILEEYSQSSIDRDKYNNKQYVLIRDGKAPTDVWQFPTVRGNSQENEPHPTQKPIELVSKAILASSKLTNQVYDPFGGSGTTMVACEQLARQCRMIEVEPKYVSVCLQRMKDMGLTPALVEHS